MYGPGYSFLTVANIQGGGGAKMNILGIGNSGKHLGAVFGSKSEVDVLVVPCENFTQVSMFLEFERKVAV